MQEREGTAPEADPIVGDIAVNLPAASKPSSAKAKKLLNKMRSNPHGDWQISDFEQVAKGVGIKFSPPSHGSHYKASSEHLPIILTIPAKKPIKAPYVRQFVGMCKAHLAVQSKDEE